MQTVNTRYECHKLNSTFITCNILIFSFKINWLILNNATPWIFLGSTLFAIRCFSHFLLIYATDRYRCKITSNQNWIQFPLHLHKQSFYKQIWFPTKFLSLKIQTLKDLDIYYLRIETILIVQNCLHVLNKTISR